MKTSKKKTSKGFNIVGKENKTSQVLDPYRPHRWIIEKILGEEDLHTFAYARNVEIPEHIPSQGSSGTLKVYFYDVPLHDGTDVLQNLISLSYKPNGTTVIKRTDGSGNTSAGWHFNDCKISKIIMPKLDYRLSKLSIIEVHIAFKNGIYGAKCLKS